MDHRKEGQNSLANKSSVWLLIPVAVGGRVECLHPLIPSLLLGGLCISSPKEVKPFSPALKAELALSLGGQEQMAEGGPGLNVRSCSCPFSRTSTYEPGAACWRKEDGEEDRQGTTAEGTPNRPAPSRPAADHRHIRESSQDQKNCPTETTGLS